MIQSNKTEDDHQDHMNRMESIVFWGVVNHFSIIYRTDIQVGTYLKYKSIPMKPVMMVS